MKAGIIGILVIILIAGIGVFFLRNKPPESLTPIPPQTSTNLAPDELANGKLEIKNSQSIDPNLVIGSDEKVDNQASFAIFTNGTFREFSASMYHNLDQDVFIESSNPNTVKIKKSGITWDDFFKTLPFKLDEDCLTTGTGQTFCSGNNGILKFYLNGQLEPGALEKEINQGDKLLVSFGEETQPVIETQIEKIPDPNL